MAVDGLLGLYAKFDEGMKAFSAACPQVDLTTDPEGAVSLIAMLQLALRHPGAKGHTAKRVRHMVDRLIARMEAVSPVLGPLLRMGDNPQHDIPSSPLDKRGGE
jgi:hypothetical protein